MEDSNSRKAKQVMWQSEDKATALTATDSLQDDHTVLDRKVVVLGVCAMHKKTNSAAMKMMLSRLSQHPCLETVVFEEETILHQPIEEWPICNCLLAFFSLGFPLDKAIAYWHLRKPMLINDLESQYDLLDRIVVHETLVRAGVPTPKYAVLNRYESRPQDSNTFWKEDEDTLQVADKMFHKPFVEKPVSAEDHNVRIYFPTALGGGSQQLFRKVKDRSSRYSRENTIRKTGSYIYEDFLATDGTDVKVYTVGPDYAHAEARKSPGLDGKVERNSAGKEVRYPVVLNATEKLIARKVSETFKQTVCGFDLLRTNGKSYVCDVNGFSLVTNSRKYNEDCAQILLEMIFSKLAPELFPSILPSVEYLAEDVPVPIPTSDSGLELRCVMAIIRHGDRTPKQKMKMVVTHERFFQFVEKHDLSKKREIILKAPSHLQEVLDIASDLLKEIETNPSGFGDTTELVRKLKQTKAVLEMYDFTGINRKVQFKYIRPYNGHSKAGKALLMILKWGGEVTPAGEKQAEEFGTAFRCIYPDGAGEYGSLPGSGFLRLHSTYRHDLKVYASDEGRVQITAAAFVKGLLDLDGSLVPLLSHLVKTQNTCTLLDNAPAAKDLLAKVKKRLHGYMHTPGNYNKKKVAPTNAESLLKAIDATVDPVKACDKLYECIQGLTSQLVGLLGQDVLLYNSESIQLLTKRWQKLEKDFKQDDGKYDISKIPDIYDCIKYDMLHNSHLGLKVAYDLYIQSMHLADLVMPQEYGITSEEKTEVAFTICCPLLSKIQADICNTLSDSGSDVMNRLDPKLSSGVTSPMRHVRTRLYFTTESHVHSMFNLLRYSGLCQPSHPEWKEALRTLGATPELNYMAQIVFMLFEDKQEPEDSEERYKVEIHFTPGAKGREEIIASEESVDSAENAKADISKTLLYTSLKRLVPENKQSNPLPSTLSSMRLCSKTSCVQPPCDLVEHIPQRRSKSKSLPSIFYVPPSTNDTNDQDSVISTHPVDITAQPIPELAPLKLNDSPVSKEPHLINGPSISVKPLQRLFTLPLSQLMSFLQMAIDNHL